MILYCFHEVLPVEAKHIAHDILREDALVLEVVDGVERADLLVAMDDVARGRFRDQAAVFRK